MTTGVDALSAFRPCEGDLYETIPVRLFALKSSSSPAQGAGRLRSRQLIPRRHRQALDAIAVFSQNSRYPLSKGLPSAAVDEQPVHLLKWPSTATDAVVASHIHNPTKSFGVAMPTLGSCSLLVEL